jgi:hypothetical protein
MKLHQRKRVRIEPCKCPYCKTPLFGAELVIRERVPDISENDVAVCSSCGEVSVIGADLKPRKAEFRDRGNIAQHLTVIARLRAKVWVEKALRRHERN